MQYCKQAKVKNISQSMHSPSYSILNNKIRKNICIIIKTKPKFYGTRQMALLKRKMWGQNCKGFNFSKSRVKHQLTDLPSKVCWYFLLTTKCSNLAGSRCNRFCYSLKPTEVASGIRHKHKCGLNQNISFQLSLPHSD